ncbi:VanZ family protein [Candidatus Pelagibacter sp.]|uniref:VanZ family protein n=1 Tax=Candidatus Pelagibacter sp. TaxID=2024849 RepID=UPI003F82AC43
MSKFFSTYKIIFYLINIILIIFYLYPGSLLGWIIYGNKSIQPQITPNFIISSNHFYVFMLISIIGFLTFANSKINILLILYLIFLSIMLEIFHLLIPERTFQWSDLFGNLLGVIVVILLNNFINKYGGFKK